MATQLVASGGLPIGRAQAESERLQRQTTEALEAQLRGVCGGERENGRGAVHPLMPPVPPWSMLMEALEAQLW